MKGVIKVNSREYKYEITKDGEYLINGMKLEEFLEICTNEEKKAFCVVGIQKVQDVVDDVEAPQGKYKYILSENLST